MVGAASSFDHLVAERDAFGIVLFEPLIGKFLRREHLEVVDVANFLAGINIDPRPYSCGVPVLQSGQTPGVNCPLNQAFTACLLIRPS